MNQISGDQWAWIDSVLTDMAAHHINTVWLVNTSTANMKEFTIRAATHGIYVIPNPPEINGRGDIYTLSQPDQETRISNLMAAWGDAPAPLAWGHYDEPGFERATAIRTFLQSWDAVVPNEPVTVVTFTSFPVTVLYDVGLEYICSDLYMFFYEGVSYDAATANNAWKQGMDWLINTLSGRQPKPWVMGQTFQNVYTPLHTDANENIVIDPGGKIYWRYPTPAEARWQVWYSFARGAKGYFDFIYAHPPLVEEGVNDSGHTFTETYDTGAPTGLVTYPSLHSTPVYEATAEAFERVTANHALIARMEPLSTSTDLVLAGTINTGTRLCFLQDPTTGKKYAYAIAGFVGPDDQTVTLSTAVPGLWCVDLFTGKSYAPDGGAFDVDLRSGDAALLEIRPGYDDDPDGDGLSNGVEYQLGTDPNLADTDGDGYSDAIEHLFGYDPLDPNDVPSSLPVSVWPVVMALFGSTLLWLYRRRRGQGIERKARFS